TGASGGAGLGGALFSLNGTVTITNSALAGNTVTGVGGGTSQGGGIFNLGNGGSATLTLTNSLLGATSGGATDYQAQGPGSNTGSNVIIHSNSGFTGSTVSKLASTLTLTPSL